MMAIVPRGFDQHPAQMRVAGFGDAALRSLRTAGVLRGDQSDKRHRPWSGRKALGVAELRGDGQRGDGIDAAETSQSLDPWFQGLEFEACLEVCFDVPEPGERFIDGAEIGPMRLIECGQCPRLCPQPAVVAFGPSLLAGGEAPAVAEQEFRPAMTRSEPVSADVFATAEEIADRFFLLGRNVNGGERASAVEHRELAGVAAISFDAIAGPPGNQPGREA